MAAGILEQAHVNAANGQAKSVPQERMLRYYLTKGLIDRPTMQVTPSGRVALYGRRQLLQVLAIKRLQSRDTSLSEIQALLDGASTEELVEFTELSPSALPEEIAEAPSPQAIHVPHRFWEQVADATAVDVIAGLPGASATRGRGEAKRRSGDTVEKRGGYSGSKPATQMDPPPKAPSVSGKAHSSLVERLGLSVTDGVSVTIDTLSARDAALLREHNDELVRAAKVFARVVAKIRETSPATATEERS